MPMAAFEPGSSGGGCSTTTALVIQTMFYLFITSTNYRQRLTIAAVKNRYHGRQTNIIMHGAVAIGSNPKHNIYAFLIHLFQNIYLPFELECEKNENRQKGAGINPFLSIIMHCLLEQYRTTLMIR